MDKMVVTGGTQLNGEVVTSGAKNSALKVLFSTILADGTHRFENVPGLKDIESTSQLLASLGIETQRQGKDFLVHSKPLKNLSRRVVG